MTNMVKCTVNPGRTHSGFNDAGERVIFKEGDTVVVSPVAAARFFTTLTPLHAGAAKPENKGVDIEKETMSSEEREKAEEAQAKIDKDKAEEDAVAAEAEKAEKAKKDKKTKAPKSIKSQKPGVAKKPASAK